MPTTERIKEWLGELGKDREWLGKTLGVSKRTVDNWLSSPIEIPPRKLKRIGELMDTEPSATSILRQPLLITPSKTQFNRWNSAWKQSDFETLEEWALSGLDAMAAEYFSIKVADEPNPQSPAAQGRVTYPKGVSSGK